MKLKTNILSTLILSFAIMSCDTENNIDPPEGSHFVKYYGTDLNESGVDMAVLPSGNVLLLGNASLGTKRIYLAKVDSRGNLIWEKYLGHDTDVARDIEATLDGNFLILSDYQASANNVDLKVIKIDTSGVQMDSAVYGLIGNEKLRSITALSDGGFILTGSTEYTDQVKKPNNEADRSDIVHFRCDQNLDFNLPNWDSQYGPGSEDGGTKVFQQSVNRFYVVGYSNQQSANTNLQYYEMQSTGTANAAPRFLGTQTQDTRSSDAIVVPASMGGGYFIISTLTSPTGEISLYATMLRSQFSVDPNDDILLNEEISIGDGVQAFNAVSAAASVMSSEQGFLLLANETRLSGEDNISLSKIDQLGNTIWYVSIGSEDRADKAAAVTELPDGRILVLGTVSIGDQTKMSLFKLNSTGRLIK